MLISFFLHIYQPENQYPDILEQIVNESYRPLFKFLLKNEKAKLTLNISSILTSLWERHGYDDLIEATRVLLEREQIELTESARFHAFLPLIPQSEIKRQIELNRETHRKFFGRAYRPKGFFSPEMSYSPKIVQVLKSMGYKYIMADEIAYKGKLDVLSFDKIYRINETGLNVFFRNKRISNLIMGAVVRDSGQMVRILKKSVETPPLSEKSYIIPAMDGETFGHHRKGLEQLLFGLLLSDELENVKISDLEDRIKGREEVFPLESTWASSEKELEEGIPFDLWFNKNNGIHKLQWEFTNLAIKVVSSSEKNLRSEDKAAWQKSRETLDSALHSCHYWWASARPWWSLEMIEEGAFLMWQAVRSAPNVKSADKDLAYKLYQNILTKAFSWQRTGEVRRMSQQEKSWRKIPFSKRAKPGEYEALLDLLEKEEKKAAVSRQYEQAIRWRDALYKLKHNLDIYDTVHVIDQLRAGVDFGEFENLVGKYSARYKKINPGQPEK